MNFPKKNNNEVPPLQVARIDALIEAESVLTRRMGGAEESLERVWEHLNNIDSITQQLALAVAELRDETGLAQRNTLKKWFNAQKSRPVEFIWVEVKLETGNVTQAFCVYRGGDHKPTYEFRGRDLQVIPGVVEYRFL